VADDVHFHQGSILRYRTETRYDLIWSGGLFDYFNDRVFGRAVSQLMRRLADGGELIIGNFATPNSSRAFMELVSDWKLTLRTPEQLRRLASQTDLDRVTVRVQSEPTGVNLFLRLSR
jgi:chemotaxis methyl-accepting protein methylase